jgi:hypothetical protein
MDAKKTIIRIGRNTLSFTTLDAASAEQPIVFRPYVVRGGISMSANLREAIRTPEVLNEETMKAQVLIDTQSLLVPVEEFDEADKEKLFEYSYPAGQEKRVVLYNVLPDLKAVCLFAVNKNVATVLGDRFDAGVDYIHALTPVWRQLHQRSFTGHRNKLYGYFHNKQLHIFSFQQNRFKFCNTFDAAHAHDALYYLLYVWKQLRLENEHDELHLVGDLLQNDQAVLQQDRDLLLGELKRFLQKVYVINPSADFNRAPITEIKNIPYDLQTLFVKGR